MSGKDRNLYCLEINVILKQIDVVGYMIRYDEGILEPQDEELVQYSGYSIPLTVDKLRLRFASIAPKMRIKENT